MYFQIFGIIETYIRKLSQEKARSLTGRVCELLRSFLVLLQHLINNCVLTDHSVRLFLYSIAITESHLVPFSYYCAHDMESGFNVAFPPLRKNSILQMSFESKHGNKCWATLSHVNSEAT